VIFNPAQPLLLDFIGDPFLSELLPNLTKYVTLAQQPQYKRHAVEKAKELFNQISILLKKAERSASIDVKSESTGSKSFSQEEETRFRSYRELRPEQKIACFLSRHDLVTL